MSRRRRPGSKKQGKGSHRVALFRKFVPSSYLVRESDSLQQMVWACSYSWEYVPDNGWRKKRVPWDMGVLQDLVDSKHLEHMLGVDPTAEVKVGNCLYLSDSNGCFRCRRGTVILTIENKVVHTMGHEWVGRKYPFSSGKPLPAIHEFFSQIHTGMTAESWVKKVARQGYEIRGLRLPHQRPSP